MLSLNLLPDFNPCFCNHAFYFCRPGEPAIFKTNCERFSSASLIKVPILLAWMALERSGEVNCAEYCNLDDEPQVQGAGFAWKMHTRRLKYEDVLLMMIAASDNLCTNLIISKIGLERIQSIFEDIFGFHGTVLQRKLMDLDARARGLDNWITPQDCIDWYKMIRSLPAPQFARVKSMLASCQSDALLLRNIPSDSVTFYHKTGSLPGVLHDWGFTDECDLFLLTQGFEAEPPIFDLFGRLGSQFIH